VQLKRFEKEVHGSVEVTPSTLEQAEVEEGASFVGPVSHLPLDGQGAGKLLAGLFWPLLVLVGDGEHGAARRLTAEISQGLMLSDTGVQAGHGSVDIPTDEVKHPDQMGHFGVSEGIANGPIDGARFLQVVQHLVGLAGGQVGVSDEGHSAGLGKAVLDFPVNRECFLVPTHGAGMISAHLKGDGSVQERVAFPLSIAEGGE
jgi:hypothetical protein